MLAVMDAIDHLAQLRRDGTRMAELARGNLDAPVPTCPGWTLADLVEHTGFVHRWQSAAVRDEPSTFPDASTWKHGPAVGETPADWFARGVDDAIAVIGAADPDAARWTWAGPSTVRWYRRRIAQVCLRASCGTPITLPARTTARWESGTARRSASGAL